MIFIKRFFKTKHINNFCKSNLKNIHVSVKGKTAVKLSYQVIENSKTKNSSVNSIIISHGLMGQSTNWKSISYCLLNDLDPPRKIYIVDNRNHGNSPHTTDHSYKLMSDDTMQLYSTLGLKEAVLLGHSMGGRAFMYTALKYPEKVSSLIIVDISPIIRRDETKNILSEPLDILKKLAKIDLRKQKGTIHETRKYVDNKLKKLSVDRPEVRQFILQNIKQNPDESFGWKINIPVLIEKYHNIQSVDFESLVYNKPVLLVAGEESNFVPKLHIGPIKKIFPNITIKFVAKAGHMVHMEFPQLFCKVVNDFLKNKKYVTVEITPIEKHSNKPFELKSHGLYNAIIAKVQKLHGDFGVAAIKAGFVAKYCNKLTRIALVKIRHGPHRFVTSSLPFITNIDSKQVTIRTLYTGATIKQCFKFIISYQKTKLIEALSTFKTNEEKENFRKAMMDLETISNVT